MSKRLRDATLFFREFCRQGETTGAIIPSSRSLARAVTRPLAQRGPVPIRVLDCGSGTGAFTDQIVNHLRPRDTFDVVELNGAFVRTLKNRFATDPRWRGVQDITTIHELPLQEFRPAAPYDFIISGLPHGNFSCSLVEEIITCYITLLKPEGVLSYVEYMYMRSIRKTVTLGTARSRVRAVDSMMMSHLGRHQVTRDSVFKNMPPAWVHHLTALNAVPVEQAA